MEVGNDCILTIKYILSLSENTEGGVMLQSYTNC